jgi:hypothetical protein
LDRFAVPCGCIGYDIRELDPLSDRFVRQLFIAFDPGQKGGIAIHHQGIITAHTMPLVGKVLDLPLIANLVRSHSPDLAVIEKVGSLVGWALPRLLTLLVFS